MYQEETLKLNESSEGHKELVEMATITRYENVPYIDFSIKNNTFSFKVSKNAAEFLADY